MKNVIITPADFEQAFQMESEEHAEWYAVHTTSDICPGCLSFAEMLSKCSTDTLAKIVGTHLPPMPIVTRDSALELFCQGIIYGAVAQRIAEYRVKLEDWYTEVGRDSK